VFGKSVRFRRCPATVSGDGGPSCHCASGKAGPSKNPKPGDRPDDLAVCLPRGWWRRESVISMPDPFSEGSGSRFQSPPCRHPADADAIPRGWRCCGNIYPFSFSQLRSRRPYRLRRSRAMRRAGLRLKRNRHRCRPRERNRQRRKQQRTLRNRSVPQNTTWLARRKRNSRAW
jgi:hypothetical protein